MARNHGGTWVGLALLAALVLSPTRAPADPVGRWLTAGNGGVIEIDRCGGALCGRIVGLGLDRPTDPEPTDVHGRPQCGLTIIADAEKTGPDEWTGHITDPRDGRTYGARIWLDAAGRLHLRGYLGLPLFGQTVVWQPFAGRIADQCRMVG